MTQPREWYECPTNGTGPREYRVIEMPRCACGNQAEETCECGKRICPACQRKCELCGPCCEACAVRVDDLTVCPMHEAEARAELALVEEAERELVTV